MNVLLEQIYRTRTITTADGQEIQAYALAFVVKNLKIVSVVEQTKRSCVLRKVAAEDTRVGPL